MGGSNTLGPAEAFLKDSPPGMGEPAVGSRCLTSAAAFFFGCFALCDRFLSSFFAEPAGDLVDLTSGRPLRPLAPFTGVEFGGGICCCCCCCCCGGGC